MLDRKLIEELISVVLEEGADFAEIFVENKISNTIIMTDGKVDKSSTGQERGVGIRGFFKDEQVYAYTNDLSREKLLKVAKRVGTAIKSFGEGTRFSGIKKLDFTDKHVVIVSPLDVSKSEKVAVMRLAHEGASSYPDIVQVMIRFWDYVQDVVVANSEGVYAEDRRTRTRLMISAVASKDGVNETGFYGPGAAMGFEFFNTFDVREAGRKAGRMAQRMVTADFAPAGSMPVIISNAFGGVIFHEACGHALEATSVAKGASVFANKLGEKIAADCVSAVDDATIPNAWGSANIDDEGVSTQRTVLIENGILKGYLVDKFHSRQMNMPSTGSGRRQSYKFAPTSRMSNTFILPGDHHPEEIIAATDYGLYAKTMGGGSVNPSTGEFNFAVLEGYLVEKGRIVKPVRGATLIGKGWEVLQKIDMVGNDLARGQGMCGSFSGSIPADVGQPTIRVSEMIVGGRNR
ncbi:MAG: TldD/PmbA family protein [Thermotogae bacterium]|nr:MAG: TldD/PmbA family protein [Thermotogota bacterium]